MYEQRGDGNQPQGSAEVAVRVEGSGCTPEKPDQMAGCRKRRGEHVAQISGWSHWVGRGHRQRLWRETMTFIYLAWLV